MTHPSPLTQHSPSLPCAYRHHTTLPQPYPLASHINIHILDVGHANVASPVLVGCFHVEVGQRTVALAQLREGVRAGAHEVVQLIVKRVVVRVSFYHTGP